MQLICIDIQLIYFNMKPIYRCVLYKFLAYRVTVNTKFKTKMHFKKNTMHAKIIYGENPAYRGKSGSCAH